MRLEFEPTTAAIPVKPAFLSDEQFTEPADFQQLLHNGIYAAQNGDRDEARNLLMQATEIDSLNEDAWMWLASISQYPEELIAFLNNVLTVNPENERAITWLAETESLLARSPEPQELGMVDAAVADKIPTDGFAAMSSPQSSYTASSENYVSKISTCPFCADENDAGIFECKTCRAALSLSDIEGFFSNSHADRSLIHKSLSEMATEWDLNDLSEDQLLAIGIAHLNLQNFDEGLNHLRELLGRDTNNVVLAGQLNAIAIRADEMQRQNEINESKPKGKTILVVDDSATVRKLLSSKLEKSGHNVVCAVDGVDGLTKIAESLPDMVFLDINMPRKDGYEVCKEIRANPVAKELPVVMISGKDGFFDKVRGKMAGASGYVTKPFGPDALMKALETHLTAETVLEQ